MALIDVVNKVKSDLKAVADAIREKNNLTGELTLEQMADEIAWISGSGTEEEQTYILVDEDGTEITAVRTEEEVALTATANDIRIGTTAVTDDGIIEGSKEIPSYQTTEGFVVIPAGKEFAITNFRRFEFTKLQAIICAFNSNSSDSVATEKVSINGKVYSVNSTAELSTVSVNANDMSIRFGITNNSSGPYILRYFTYKEEY